MATPQISGNPIDQDKTPGDGPGCEYVTYRGMTRIAVSLTAFALLLLGLLVLRWPRCEEGAASPATAPSPAAALSPSPVAIDRPAGDTTTGGAGTAGVATTGEATTEGAGPTSDAAPAGADQPRATGPMVTSISPNRGPAAGGNAVSIHGTNLAGVTQVTFGGIPATIEQVGATVIQVKAPRHPAGPVDVALTSSPLGRRRYTFEAAGAGATDSSCGCSSGRDLLLLVILAGALGGVLHSLRSFYWYVGNRKLIRSWVPKYYFAPLTGALMAVTFFIVVQAGLSPDTASENCLVIVGIAALVGLFSEEAAEKLKKIASAVLTDKPQGADQAPPRDAAAATAGTSPVELVLTPARGIPEGGTVVEIAGLSGANLAGLPTVLFGDSPATRSEVVDGKTLKVVAPRGVGEVDVTVTLASGLRLVKPRGFVYDDAAT